MSDHPIIVLSGRYPQLSLPIRAGMKETEQYRNSVLRGQPTGLDPVFSFSEKDDLTEIDTPAGPAEILFLSEREDFEHAIMALAYRCEPHAIPRSMGATALSGLINWEKIRPHMTSDEEFARFTSVKSNYLDTIIILSAGEYSAVPASEMGLAPEEWISRSIEIRKYHELTHFVSQRLFPENKEAIRDEVIADMLGLYAAFGTYDTAAARRFLGTEGPSYRKGGRLENYSGEKDISVLSSEVNSLIDLLKKETESLQFENLFDILKFVEENRIGLNQ